MNFAVLLHVYFATTHVSFNRAFFETLGIVNGLINILSFSKEVGSTLSILISSDVLPGAGAKPVSSFSKDMQKCTGTYHNIR